MSIFETKKTNIDVVANLLLKKLKVRVNTETIETKLHLHSEYPSVLALSNCLTGLNVANQAFRLSKENYRVEDLSFPFVVDFNEDKGKLVLIHGIKNGLFKMSDENCTIKRLSPKWKIRS